MKFNFSFLKNSHFLMLFFVVSVSCAQARPVTHDPVVAKQGDTYYLFCTGPGITSFTSKDLKTWVQAKPVFAESPKWALDVAPGFNGHIWARDITLHNGIYYLYYSVSAFGKNTSAIGLVTNTTLNPDDLEYKWEDQGVVIQSVPNRDLWNAIDPNLIFDENEIYSYITEGIGEDILPKNVDFSLIDGFTKVTDKDAAVYTRRLALEEGIFVGNSAGAAIKGVLQLKEHFKPEDVVVVLFHDSGSRYVGKMFNDDWMRERGFLEEEVTKASDLIKEHQDKPLIVVRTEELVSHAIERLKKYKISQIPVMDTTGFVGSLDETDLFRSYVEDKNIADKPIKEVMGKPFPIVKANTSIEEVSKLINKDNQAVLVELENGKYHIITKHDVISSIK